MHAQSDVSRRVGIWPPEFDEVSCYRFPDFRTTSSKFPTTFKLKIHMSSGMHGFKIRNPKITTPLGGTRRKRKRMIKANLETMY